MMTRTILFVAALAAVSLPAAEALSQGPTPHQGVQADPKPTPLVKQDRDFLEEAAHGGLFDVRAGQLAQQKAMTDEVKQFGKRMVDDHTAVNGRLQQLAQQKGLNVPQQLDKKHQDKIDSLAKKTGGDFDKAYIDAMVDGHKGDVDAFDKMSKDAKDADVKAFATSTLPVLRDHLMSIQSIKDHLKT
jgi:putative membrane protein